MTDIRLPHDHGQHTEQKLADMPGIDDFQIVADILSKWGTAAGCAFSGCSATVRNVSSTSQHWYR